MSKGVKNRWIAGAVLVAGSLCALSVELPLSAKSMLAASDPAVSASSNDAKSTVGAPSSDQLARRWYRRYWRRRVV